MYLHPGVYIEHVPSGLLAIEAASTSVAVFIGPTRRGPIGEPVFISSAGQYENLFGDLGAGKGGIRNLQQEADRVGFAVNAFFLNGGSKAYILRIAESVEVDGQRLRHATALISNPEDATQGFSVRAADQGVWGNAIVVRLGPTDEAEDPDLELGYTLEIGYIQDEDFISLEAFSGLQMADDDPRSIRSVVAAQSQLLDFDDDIDLTPQFRGGTIPVPVAPDTVVTAASGFALSIGGNNVEVTFADASDDLAAIAGIIETAVNGAGLDLTGFDVEIEGDPGTQNLLITAGRGGDSGQVTVGPPAAGDSALAGLGLDTGAPVSLPPSAPVTDGVAQATLQGGEDGVSIPGSDPYSDAFATLRDYRDVSIILLPTQNWVSSGNTVIDAAVTHCEFMKNCMVVVDPPDSSIVDNRLISPKSVKDLAAPTSPYAALYYPWLKVANPHYNEDTAANLPKTFDVPPSAFAAGIWSRTDASRGVWKAPAGLAASVRGSQGPDLLIGNDIQDNLNSWGVNCIRSIIGPNVIWGGRTLATKTKPEFRYVPVRRTQNMIGESLYRALQTVVFEPNDHKLWGSLRASVGDFMSGLFRAGAFQGEKASDAYYVLCGLGSTMTQGDIDAGIVRVVVGFAPLKPAEFVVVQIKQIVGQAA